MEAWRIDDEEPENFRKLNIYKFKPNFDMSNDVILTEALFGTFYCLTCYLLSTGHDIT